MSALRVSVNLIHFGITALRYFEIYIYIYLWGGGTKARNILVATRRSPKQWTQKSSDFFKF